MLQRVSGPLFMIPGAIVAAFPPPSIQGLGVFGGFQFEVLDQTGSPDINQLAARDVRDDGRGEPERARAGRCSASSAPTIRS